MLKSGRESKKGIMMNRQSDEKETAGLAQRGPANHVAQNRSLLTQPRFLLVAWILLLLLGVLFLFGSLSDLLADGRTGLPSDHLAAFSAIAGMSWSSAQQSSPRITQFITSLEIAYAVHELVFGLLFLIIVAIPFRRCARWAWWACWVPMLANLTYTLTIGHYGTTTLVYSLIADVTLPVLLLLQIPAFFGKSRLTQ
jgi:hypothetical protein